MKDINHERREELSAYAEKIGFPCELTEDIHATVAGGFIHHSINHIKALQENCNCCNTNSNV